MNTDELLRQNKWLLWLSSGIGLMGVLLIGGALFYLGVPYGLIGVGLFLLVWADKLEKERQKL